MGEFRIGASYYPEWWNEEQWEDDFRKMADLGFNVVRMGEFAWSWYEPREGEYNFEPMKKAVALAAQYGIKTVMGTTTAVCPPWLYKKYPEVKGGNTYGNYDFGGRKGQCLSSDIFLEYAKKITVEQAKAFANNENIIGWQLDNEPGYPFNDFDDNCRKGFRKWLQNKYKTIDELNKAWYTMMFSNVYNSFDEIEIPVNAAEGGWSPGIQLDYRRYFSFTFNRLLKMEAEIIRTYSENVFIYTNWPGANWSVDCFNASDEFLDYAAWDNYVAQPVNDNYRVQLNASMEHSFDRRLSCGKQKFIVAEQHGVVGANGNPDVIRAQSWLNVSHGAFATIFFEWRSPLGGPEQAYDSILGRDRNYNECEQPIRKLAAELKEHYTKIDGAKTVSDIAAIYSYENSWAMPNWVVDGFYDMDFFYAYGGFKNVFARNVDVCAVTDTLSGYKIIIAPNLKIVSESEAEKLISYVKNGGILAINTECGTKDKNNLIYEMLEPGLFSDMCGAEVVSRISAAKMTQDEGVKPCVEFQNGGKIEVSSMLHKLRVKDAETVAVFKAGKLTDKPAVTIKKYGEGYAVLFAVDGNDILFYEELAKYLKTRFCVEPLLEADEGAIISSRQIDGKEYIFAVNMKDSPIFVYPGHKLYDELNGKIIDGKHELKAYDVLFAKKIN